MIDTLTSYIVMLAPALISFLGILAGVLEIFKSARLSKKHIELVVAEGKKAFDQIKDSNEFKELKNLCERVVSQNDQLQKALIECTEALTRIRKRHPELFTEEGEVK